MSKLVHIEHNSQDPAAAKKFYKGLFGWKMKDMKMGDTVYTMFETGDGVGGGLQKAPMADQPSAWLNYIGVASVNKAMAKATKLGATVVVPYYPIPGMGALGVFVDPTGATCAVWEMEAAAKTEQKAKPAKDKKKDKKPKKAAKKATKKAAKKATKKAAKKATKKAAKKATKKAAKKATKKAAKKATKKAAKPAKAEPAPAPVA